MIYAFVESHDNQLKKSGFEVVSYAKTFNQEVTAICFNVANAEDLKNYGADNIVSVQDASISNQKTDSLVAVLAQISGSDAVVLSHSNLGATIAPLLAVKKEATLVTNLLDAPTSTQPFTAKRNAFSGKGIMNFSTENTNLVLTVVQNAFGMKENTAAGNVSGLDAAPSVENKVTVTNVEKASGKLDLKEAELVVSAGRGLKAAENWTMIEELAEILGAGTACSKPVSDLGWRPHSEHVGQTGKAIAPNLYIAIGISGAIQHLAGVNKSKTIVVINNDAEAPFFKSADYGIVGDAFEVVPALIEKLKEYKS